MYRIVLACEGVPLPLGRPPRGSNTNALRRLGPTQHLQTSSFCGVSNRSGSDDLLAALLHEAAHRVCQLAIVPLLPEIVEKCRCRRRFLLEN